jgi:hypothetical protein
MKKLILFALLPFLASPVFAQTLSSQVIGSSGGFLTAGNGSLSYTVGELAVQQISSGSGMLTQGFQQPIVTNPLPLDFLSFTATLANGVTQLEWVTAHEVNTDYFEVERSGDGAVFTSLTTVQSDGGAGDNSYHAVDPGPLPGTDYYRLKEVDLGGLVTYSPVVVVKFNRGLTCMVFPNPASDQVFIQIQSGSTAEVAVELYDLRGRLLLSRPAQLLAGANQLEFDIRQLAAGAYVIRIVGLDGIPPFTIIKH